KSQRCSSGGSISRESASTHCLPRIDFFRQTRENVHTRRMATFLIGAWLAGCILMASISVLTSRAPATTLDLPHPAVANLTRQIGHENMAQLLRHSAAEQSRFLLKRWELAQILIGAALGACLFLGTQRRILPMLLCGILLMIVLFQYRITNELNYLGKET